MTDGTFTIQNGIAYANHDGVELAGDLYLPKNAQSGAKAAPALVAVHGGGWVAGVRGAFQYWGPYLAARGIAVFAISYRLATKNKTFPEAVQDVLAGVQFVRGKAAAFGIDPARIGLLGASAGAHLASLAALGGKKFAGGYPQDPFAAVDTSVKALIGVYGIYDAVAMWTNYQVQGGRDNNFQKFMGASPMENRQLYFDASPISYATLRQQRDRRVPRHRHRGRSGRPQSADRSVPAGAQAGRLFRAALHRAGRAALLDERSDRRAGEPHRLCRAAIDALPCREAVTSARFFRHRYSAAARLPIAALTAGITLSAISSMDFFDSAGSAQSMPQ